MVFSSNQDEQRILSESVIGPESIFSDLRLLHDRVIKRGNHFGAAFGRIDRPAARTDQARAAGGAGQRRRLHARGGRRWRCGRGRRRHRDARRSGARPLDHRAGAPIG
jgi:hypothetical protein